MTHRWLRRQSQNEHRDAASARTRRPRGFSLVEVMVSMSLLAVGMTAIVTTFGLINDSAEHQRRMTQALHLAEGTMEELLVRYADDADLTDGNHTGSSYGPDGVGTGTFFQTAWVVESGVPIDHARQLRVTISWTERTGVRTISLVTVRT